MRDATRAICLSVMMAASAAAGPLNPPPGPVAPTFKTLAEVEPRIPIGPQTTPGDADSLYQISTPGSYYLTGNITGVVNFKGIEITVDDVTIDLNGFELIGVPRARAAIEPFGERANITIENGTIRGWNTRGLDAADDRRMIIRNVRSVDNSSTGFSVGNESIVSDCIAQGNGGSGFSLGRRSRVERCISQSNSADGFVGLNDNTLEACIASGNTVGFHFSDTASLTGCTSADNTSAGFVVFDRAIIQGCTARNNAFAGYVTSRDAIISDSTAHGNTNEGFRLGDGGSARGCTAANNGQHGIVGDEDCAISACTASGNGQHGIKVNAGCTIDGCTVVRNGQNGIDALAHSILTGNLCRGNAGHGIRVFARCRILENTCSGNGTEGLGCGIRADDLYNHIDSNQVLSNEQHGISTFIGACVVVRNHARDNNGEDFDVDDLFNTLGPIVTSTFELDNPWANFGLP